ncbi:hypothetical protein [Ectobacillus sp. sgz5001026]|uniref:hypothetical protein n=1 Tax=Ectobacillus sp. sgz5001026 TaxID=3242473 RepID=UPI0036D30FE8
MILKEIKGYELEKALPNTSEDFFNRSEVTYEYEGIEKTLHVLYVRFFEEQLNDFTPFTGDPVFRIGENDVNFKEIVALACLLKDPSLTERKRVYINSKEELASYFDEENVQQVKIAIEQLNSGMKAQ